MSELPQLQDSEMYVTSS